MVAAVTIREAARELQVSARCIQNWIRAGAPTVTLGGSGPGRGSTVHVDDLRRWRDRSGDPAPIDTASIDEALWSAFTRAPEGYARPAWQELGLSRRQAASFLVEMFSVLHIGLSGRPPEALPPNCEALFRIALSLG